MDYRTDLCGYAYALRFVSERIVATDHECIGSESQVCKELFYKTVPLNKINFVVFYFRELKRNDHLTQITEKKLACCIKLQL